MTKRRRAILIATGGVLAAALWIRMGPLPAGLLDFRQAESTRVLDRRGEVLYESRAADGSKAMWLTADTLPDSLVNATVAAEDRRFWHHPGVDPIALTRAAVRDIRSRRVVEGGSTITQQVAKLLLARLRSSSYGVASSDPRGFWVKAREAILALRLEHRFSKREILALYLNLSPYGNQLTGAERASRAYFGRGVDALTPAQAAFLAALPQRPSWFNPYRDPARVRARQQNVIVQMGLLGALKPDAVREAMDERLTISREPAVFLAPHFVTRVLAEAGANRPQSITTTLDADLQRDVEGIIRSERRTLARIGAQNVAVVVLDNRTGEWLAWEGSGDYTNTEHGGAIDGVVTPRQPGSALKPFTYALAFEEGESPATVLPDVPSFFPTAQDGVVYSPRNYDNQFRGPLLARSALAGSENVPAVALASRIGVPNLLRFLRAAGFDTFDKTAAYYGLGVTLGDAEVRLDQLVIAYAAFARGGVAVRPRSYVGSGFSRIDEYVGSGFSRIPDVGSGFSRIDVGSGERLMSERSAFWITDILSDDDAREFAFGRGGSLEFPFQVAVKTGTSQGYHDNWTVGYTREVTVGVWVGNFDRRPLIGSSGVSGAGPIFHDVMMAAEERAVGALPREDQPATIAGPSQTVQHAVCALSGMAATPWCPAQANEWVPSDSPQAPCTWHRSTPAGIVVDWPADYQAWASTQKLIDRVASASTTVRTIPVSAVEHPVPISTVERATRAPAVDTAISAGRAALRIVSPPDGTVYLIDPTLRKEFQTLPFRATSDGEEVVWRVDNTTIQPTATGRVEWSLAPGTHVITATDASGHHARAEILVK